MRSTCSAVPARPTASSRSSVSGVATRVSARTLEYDSSPRASACGQPRQRAERARHPHVLAGGARGEPHAPGEPGGAGAEAGVPALAGVELADEVEQAGGGGVEMRRQLGDLVAEPVQIRGLQGGGNERASFHARVSLRLGRLYTAVFGATCEPPERAIQDARSKFFDLPVLSPIAGPVRAAEAAFAGHRRHAALSTGRSCQAETAAVMPPPARPSLWRRSAPPRLGLPSCRARPLNARGAPGSSRAAPASASVVERVGHPVDPHACR